jgi:hypothetical protein
MSARGLGAPAGRRPDDVVRSARSTSARVPRRARLSTGLRFADTEVGGLSGISYDERTGRYLAVSDDRSERAPARVYTLSLDLSAGRLADDGASVVAVTVLHTPDGGTFDESTIDGEGVAVGADGGFFVSSEGEARSGVPPFVRRFAADGSHKAELALPEYLTPSADRRAASRDNLALESLTCTPDGGALFTATENALLRRTDPEPTWRRAAFPASSSWRCRRSARRVPSTQWVR